MMQSICSFGRVLSRGGGGSIGSLILLKQTCLPALQLVMANEMPTLTSNTTSRNVHINPYSGREDREGERDCQRKVAQHAQHGLKTEFMDYSTTIMQNAKMGLHESAEKRHRQRERNTEKKRGCSGKCEIWNLKSIKRVNQNRYYNCHALDDDLALDSLCPYPLLPVIDGLEHLPRQVLL
eukprot:scaffold542_cov202-Alexandrium_tamarense.AAC.23